MRRYIWHGKRSCLLHVSSIFSPLSVFLLIFLALLFSTPPPLLAVFTRFCSILEGEAVQLVFFHLLFWVLL